MTGWHVRLTVLGLLTGLTALGAVLVVGRLPAAQLPWTIATVIGLVTTVAVVVNDLRRKHFGVDVIAVLALGGALLAHEYLAGALIALMFATGQLLEGYAQRRAHRDLDALLDRAPRSAHLREGDALRTVPVADVRVGDVVVVLSGEVVPVDGRLVDAGLFDESVLTGESVPVDRPVDDVVRAGVVNVGASATVRAVRTAERSAYAGVVRLATAAVADSAPVVRLADRFAVGFVPLTLVATGLAWWLSGDAVRALAVLVTATPCPLLLAVPVAVTSGMSAASRRGVVVKDGAALERLGHAEVALMDKTGTVTEGRPRVVDVLTAPGVDRRDLLAKAAAVERYSPHVLATAVVHAADAAGAPALDATQVAERPGVGAEGVVAGEPVTVGGRPAGEPAEWARAAERRVALDGAAVIWVSVAGRPAGAFVVRDRVRADAMWTLSRLRAAGVRWLALVTGDRSEAAADVAALLDFDEVVAGCAPETKVERVRAARRRGVTVAVGDGVNDAPALAAADVGVALGARGITAVAQAADVVLTDDGLDRLADAVETARHARAIAVQSAAAGIGLSLLAMAAAGFGLLAPAVGALVQEGIDVVVILNALRALIRPDHTRLPRAATERIARFAGEHEELTAARMAVREAADSLSDGDIGAAEERIRRAHRLVVEQLLPHERAEEHELLPAVAPVVGGTTGTAVMSRGHAEIERLARRLSRHLAGPGPLRADQVDDLRATLYGLDAVLTLHFAQEEEGYFVLAGAATATKERDRR
ncbi:MAG TPA: heavy metal translocating P-type ATPase [Pseudonocardiaceae bacterium]|nr:heavy metal translocating P-type ATPase [Pseudonocardiaceae bacterium]